MSPELIYPQRFGFEEVRQTKSSDCYALGMVIYETIAGNVPFHEHHGIAVVVEVLNGERPPRAASFTDSLWKVLERCWDHDPDARPSIENVLWCLEQEEALTPPGPDVKMKEGSSISGDFSCKFPDFVPPQGLTVSAFKRIQRYCLWTPRPRARARGLGVVPDPRSLNLRYKCWEWSFSKVSSFLCLSQAIFLNIVHILAVVLL